MILNNHPPPPPTICFPYLTSGPTVKDYDTQHQIAENIQRDKAAFRDIAFKRIKI